MVMYYAPHTLQKRIAAETVSDEFGRPLPPAQEETWADVCRCRCDHNRDEEIMLENGEFVKPSYHVVVGERRPDVKTGDYVRCLEEDGTVRGEGKVCNTRTLNYLPYAEIYM